MTSAVAAFGVTLKREGVAVAEVLELGNIRYERDFIDVTNHASSGGYEEFIASGIIKTGELTILCNSVASDTAQAAIKADWLAKTASTYTIAFPDGQGFSGEAIVTAYEYEANLRDQIKLSITLKWTSTLTETTDDATDLTALALTTAILYPNFSGSVYEYIAVSTGDTCTVTATFSAGTVKLYREGVFVQNLFTDTPSGSISLGADGTVTDLEIVVSETTKADVTYKISVSNAA